MLTSREARERQGSIGDAMSGDKVWILSVHYESAFWAQAQRKYLDRFVDVPHERLFAVKDVSREMFRSTDELLDYSGAHGDGLNVLASAAIKRASDDDWLLFLDSDALPIRPLSSSLDPANRFLAVQRLENLGDIQPHPSFCLIGVDVWKALGSDWSRGSGWTNKLGKKVHDVGGNLLEAIERQGVDWVPMHRQNRVNFDDLWFALYGKKGQPPLVYHHGAGSRTRHSRLGVAQRADSPAKKKRRQVLVTLWALLRAKRFLSGVDIGQVYDQGSNALEEPIREVIGRREDFWKLFM